MSIVIKIENLYKEYRLGIIGHGTLYRDLQSWWAKARGKPDPNSLLGMANPNQGKDRILALNKIDLEVNDGEVLGIIGANGAGKSTLLKILSKVTAPTRGTIKYKGRVSSLLEVGTGFHTELTGRENIFLNGAINGMNKKEVSRKLDEIVDFAGVDKYLDTPVKRYSSGMHVRLGFAVAAHLDPDILVVDEVLAVGDAEFQKKAIGKMKDVSRDEGRTVLFVSHNMYAIRNLCHRVILLDNGRITFDSTPELTINHYLNESNKAQVNLQMEKVRGKGSGKLVFTKIEFRTSLGKAIDEPISGDELTILFHYEKTGEIDSYFLFDIRIKDEGGSMILPITSGELKADFKEFKNKGVIEVHFPKLTLRGGGYIMDIYATDGSGPINYVENVLKFNIQAGDFYRTGKGNTVNGYMAIEATMRN